jgi:hypothetical protein
VFDLRVPVEVWRAQRTVRALAVPTV